MKDNDRAIIAVLISSSWAGIEWILPVLTNIKTICDHKICVVFSDDVLYLQKHKYPQLNDFLINCSDEILYPGKVVKTSSSPIFYTKLLQKFVKLIRKITLNKLFSDIGQGNKKKDAVSNYTHMIFKNHINKSAVKVILKEAEEDTKFKIIFQDSCKEARVVCFPHATTIHYYHDTNSNLDGKTYSTRSIYSGIKFDLFMVHTKYDLLWWGKRLPSVDKIIPIGFPRYEKQWVEKLVASSDFKINGNSRKVLFVSRHAHDVYLPRKNYTYLMNSMSRLVRETEGISLVIKPHPSQSESEMLDFFSGSGNVSISYEPVIKLSLEADLVISVFSSCILDAQAVNKPVVEFYQYDVPLNDDHEFFEDNGKITGVYRKLNLCLPVDTYEDLYSVVSSFFLKGLNSSFSEINNNFKFLMKEYPDPIKNASNKILSFLN